METKQKISVSELKSGKAGYHQRSDLIFADDIALVSEEIEQAQELLLKKKLKKWDSSSIPKRLKLCNTVIKALSRSLLKMGKTPKKS